MQGTILVTGGTGKTARRLLPRLIDAGAQVRAASRSGNPQGAAPGIHFDWYDDTTWDAALEGATAAYLVGPALDPSPDRVLLPFLDRARTAGVRRAVLLSAMGVEQAPSDAPMRRVELAVQATVPEATLLRPNWFMQNFDEGFWQPTIAAQGAFFLPAGDAEISVVDAEDVAAVAAVALLTGEHGGGEYTLTGPEAITNAEAAEQISAVAGREVRYVPISDDEFRDALVGNGLDPGYAQMLTGLFGVARAGFSAEVTEAVEQVTGRPARSFAGYAGAAAGAWASQAATV